METGPSALSGVEASGRLAGRRPQRSQTCPGAAVS